MEPHVRRIVGTSTPSPVLPTVSRAASVWKVTSNVLLHQNQNAFARVNVQVRSLADSGNISKIVVLGASLIAGT